MTHIAWADEVKIEVRPSKPVAGEVFQAYFRIFTKSSSEPEINFTPFNVEVVGKSNQGLSISSIYSNGRLTTTREVTIVYDLVTQNTGVSGLRDIVVNVDGKNLRHQAITFNVLKEPEVAADVFVMADVPKKSVFLGEGIVVRYYLYSKVPVSNLDVKKYPKLNGFLKRFLQEPERSERVSVDGQLYIRNQIYAAKLFPEKLGEQKIDSLQLTAAVVTSSRNDPFGGFGLNREVRNKTINSETIKIEVKPLPETNRPANFTGLIGKHEFDLQFSKSKLLVNEPLEFKLTISGGGSLENVEAPVIIKNPSFEEFESNGDLKITDANQAIKTFEYTFLAKTPTKIPATTVGLSYFDPDSERYVPVQLPIPEIVIGGVAPATQNKNREEAKKSDSTIISLPKIEKPRILSSPVIQQVSDWRAWISYFNLILFAIALIFFTGIMVSKRKIFGLVKSKSVPRVLKGHEFDLHAFTNWLSPLMAMSGKSPTVVIKEADLSDEAKRYFIDLLNSYDYKEFSHLKREMKYNYISKYYKELDHYIQSRLNEDHYKSSRYSQN
jgi:hypothetical protein